MRILECKIVLSAVAAIGLLMASNNSFAQALDAAWFTQIHVRQCRPDTTPELPTICTGNNPTITEISDLDLAQTGAASLRYFDPGLMAETFHSVGYAGPGLAPAISAYSIAGPDQRTNSHSFGFQRYTFVQDGPLEVLVTYTYSQSGVAPSQASRNPRGNLDGGVTAFQMENDEFIPENCSLFSDILDVSAGSSLLTCLILNGQTLFDGTLVEFVGLQNFENHEFTPPLSPAMNATETLSFSIDGQIGDVYYISADIFLFANKGGFANSRNTLRVDLQNPDVVEPSFPVESFAPAPPPTDVVDIDIRPYASTNKIRPGRWGIIPVAILGSVDFDALQVDPATVRFGPDGANAIPWFVYGRDINKDGFSDLLLLFKTRKTGIQCGDTSATLEGLTYLGVPVFGSDDIQTVRCR